MILRSNSRIWIFRQFGFWLWLTLVISGVLVVSFADNYNWQPDDVATQNIRASRDFSYVSQLRSMEAQEEAVRKVAPVYTDPDPVLARQQYDRARQILAYLRELRADTYLTESQRYAWVLAVPELRDLPLNTATTLLTLPDANWNRVQLEFLGLLDQIMRQQRIREDGLEAARELVPSLIALDLAQDEALSISALVQRLLRPNIFYDEAATQAAQQQARESVGPAYRTFRSGEIIVREGSVISPEDIEALQELGLTSQERDWLDHSAPLLFSATIVLALGLYLWRLHPETLDGSRMELMLTFLLTIFVLMERMLLPTGDLLPYLFPGAAAAMLLATTIGVPAAIGGAFLLGAVGGWIAGHSLGIAALVIVGSLFAALTLPRYEYAGAIFRSGLWAGLATAIVLFIFNVTEVMVSPLALLLKIFVCIVGGLISGGLAVGGLFLLTPIFDLTTTFRLTELSRPNHPLLQRLLREAPATFNHVMMVASLAEQAAERIGANALLTRVGAYYHDIGKLLRPYFFVENQQGLSNPHDRLDPYTSVDVLVGHIRDGIKLAEQYHLPAKVRAFIPEHHGTMRASFFYQKAIDAAGADTEVDEAHFRYPGPIPRSLETALLMLADGCEAATRARRPSTPEELAGVVDFIFEQRITDGQLDDCPITMKELHMTKQTYIDLLRGAYHPRVSYPESIKPGKDETHGN
ncbi:MAG: HDIG domain-containing protein [Anaerolineae bacterium]|nr:HDIG domain-containing protein [Anaerolineae bacterium]